MALNFRVMALGIAALGLAVGVAFGAGVAYGRGDPKTVQGGLTAQQIQSLLGITGAQAAGTGGQGTGAQGTGGQGAANNAAAAGSSVSGRITAVEGQTITIQTRQGSQKVTFTPSTAINKIAAGSQPDLKDGLTVVAAVTRKDDGSFEATAITQVPTELQALVTGGAGGMQGATGTPTPGGR